MSRCIPYKQLDLLVDAFNENGKSLILVTNTDTILYRELKERSQENITWVFNPNTEEKMVLLRDARGFLFPPEEDFGLVPVEAMMVGTPVIAY
jgi:glycosyltransferase involved in cell wall biosynthesis